MQPTTQNAFHAIQLSTEKLFEVFQVRPTRPDGYTTNSFHLVSKLTDVNLNRFTTAMKQAVNQSLISEPERLLADFAISEAYRSEQAEIYRRMANFQENAELVDFFQNLASSEKDIAELQSDLNRTIISSGYVNDMQRINSERKESVAMLKSLLVGSAIPQATPDEWRKSISFICNSIKSDTKNIKNFRKEVRAMFTDLGFQISDEKLDNNVLQQIENVVNTLKTLQQSGKVRDIVARMSYPFDTDDEKRLAAQTGDLEREILWPKFITAAQGIDIAAENLESLRPAMKKTLTLSANESTRVTEGEGLSDRIGTSAVSDTLNEEFLDAAAKERKEKEIDSAYPEARAITGEFHRLAKVAHILLHAEVKIDFFGRGETLGEANDRSPSAVPAIWFAHYPFLKDYFVEMYRGHIPQDLRFTVFDTLMDYMSRGANKPIEVQKLKASLAQALRTDITNILSAVHEAARSIAGVNVDEIVEKVDGKIVNYNQAITTDHPDHVLRTATSIEDFIASDLVVVNSNRPLRITADPVSRSLGFSEAILGEDVIQMNVINRSVKMKAIGDLFNAVQNHRVTTVNSLDIHTAPARRLEMAYSDHLRGLRLKTSGTATTVRASEICSGASYDNPEHDFFAQVQKEDTDKISILLGQHTLDHKRYEVGNVWGTFSFGLVTPSYDTKSSDADATFADLGYKVLKRLADDYFVNVHSVEESKDHHVILDEKNDKYANRLALISEVFSDGDMGDKDTLRRLAAMRALNSNTYNIVRPEDIDLVSRYHVKVRDDAQSIIDLVSNRHADRIFAFYQPAVVDLFTRSLTEVLSIEERALMRQPEVANQMNAICESINSVLPAEDENRLLALVYFNSLLEDINIKLELPAIKQMVANGYDPLSVMGGVSYKGSKL